MEQLLVIYRRYRRGEDDQDGWIYTEEERFGIADEEEGKCHAVYAIEDRHEMHPQEKGN